MKQITDLVEFFNKITMPLHATIVTRTPVKMNKNDVATKTIPNPHGEIFKVQSLNVSLNANYETMVNAHRFLEQKNMNFESEARKWGEHVNGVIVKKDGQLYVNVIELSKQGEVSYEKADGTKIQYNEFAAFVPVYKPSPKQALDKEVKVRSFKMKNVIGMFIESLEVRYTNV